MLVKINVYLWRLEASVGIQAIFLRKTELDIRNHLSSIYASDERTLIMLTVNSKNFNYMWHSNILRDFPRYEKNKLTFIHSAQFE
jgi:hypothetical protein